MNGVQFHNIMIYSVAEWLIDLSVTNDPLGIWQEQKRSQLIVGKLQKPQQNAPFPATKLKILQGEVVLGTRKKTPIE